MCKSILRFTVSNAFERSKNISWCILYRQLLSRLSLTMLCLSKNVMPLLYMNFSKIFENHRRTEILTQDKITCFRIFKTRKKHRVAYMRHFSVLWKHGDLVLTRWLRFVWSGIRTTNLSSTGAQCLEHPSKFPKGCKTFSGFSIRQPCCPGILLILRKPMSDCILWLRDKRTTPYNSFHILRAVMIAVQCKEPIAGEELGL